MIYDGFIAPNSTEYLYNENGDICFKKYKDSERIVSSWYNFNDNGLIDNINSELQNIKEVTVERWVSNFFVYNSNQQLIEKKEFYATGEIFRLTRYQYDSFGNKISEYNETNGKFDNSITQKFDSQNRIIKKTMMLDIKLKLYSVELTDYNDTNNSYRSICKKSYGNYIETKFYKNNLIKKEEYFENGKQIKSLIYYYQELNLIRQEQKVKDKIVHWSEFLYEEYQ